MTPANTAVTGLAVERTTLNQATAIPSAVVDGRGTWRTFIGGGTSAGF
jgi:hypothetical protein